MPNHVTHSILVAGPKNKLDTFVATFLGEESGKNYKDEPTTWQTFDFDKLVPMPEVLKGSESSSSVAVGLALLGRDDVPSGFGTSTTLEDMLTYPWVIKEDIKDVETLRARLMKTQPDAIDKAKAAIKCFEETGHTSWYDWSIDNWGTKWNAYDVNHSRLSDESLEIKFDTAWSPPEPIFEALAVRPEVEGLSITILAFDEGWNFAYKASIVDGTLDGGEVEATNELYEEVYGEAPYSEEEED